MSRALYMFEEGHGTLAASKVLATPAKADASLAEAVEFSPFPEEREKLHL